ncbi:MAG: acylneuraminate cytidylyltransferase family protein [Firmicutes bacterium]|nr:acylneuraminate cytidylyltransferase family protein [Bacillota bacterium]
MSNSLLLAVIPARGGSKRLPLKNLRLLAGKPLICHTIEAARKAPAVSRVLVSTDDPRIREVSLAAGAEVPFLRPAELAGDHTAMVDVIIHAVAYLAEKENQIFPYFAVLQPTSPLRTAEDIDRAFALLRDSPADSLVSVSARPLRSEEIYRRKEGFIEPSFSPADRQCFLRLNGALYMGKTSLLKERRLLGDAVLPYPMPESRSLDIDYPEDLELARILLKGGIGQ